MEFKGSRTYKNVQDAFSGESQVRSKYTYFSSKAKKEGYEQIASIFLEAADNEKEHAKIWYKLLQENGDIPSTIENLKSAAYGEREEWTDMYDRMAEEADAEGFHDIAELFRGVGEVERRHEERFLQLLRNVEEGIVFSRDGEMIWKCRNCGHVHIGKQAPDKCPVCAHPTAYFELMAQNF